MKISSILFFIILFSTPSTSFDTEMIEILSGPFVMGDNGDINTTPQHEMHMESYWIDLYEVTNDEFAKLFPQHSFWKGSGAHPATDMTWGEAQSYCMKTGKRLPSSAEWEKAARGGDARLYPWGNKALRKKAHPFYSGLIKRRVGLNKKDVSPYGVRDMAGSVWEWTADEGDGKKVTRGGLWNFHLEYEFSKTFDRNLVASSKRFPFLGFRCAR